VSPPLINLLKIRTGHEKPGKSWNFAISFLGQERHEIEVWVVESHEKVIHLLRMKRQKKNQKLKKQQTSQKTGFNSSGHNKL